MKTRTHKLATLLTAGLIAGAGAAAHAAVIPVSYDFGSGTGQTTYQDAGFADVAATNLSISNQTDSVNFLETANGSTLRNGGITRTFSGLGDGARNDFTITAEFSLINFRSWVSNSKPGGVLLFANSSSLADLNGTGLAIQIHSVGTLGQEELRITNGINGSVLSSVKFQDGEIADTGGPTDLRRGQDGNDDDVVRWTVDVSFSGTDTMDVVATLTRIVDGNGTAGDWQSVSFSTTSASTYIGGEYFGFGGRYRNNDATDLHSFSVIPEPGTLVLVGIALGSLLLFRRRRK